MRTLLHNTLSSANATTCPITWLKIQLTRSLTSKPDIISCTGTYMSGSMTLVVEKRLSFVFGIMSAVTLTVGFWTALDDSSEGFYTSFLLL